MTTWVNGSLVPDDRPVVRADDHGLTVGDGVFETAKVVDGTVCALTRHLRRLERSTAGLGLPVDLDLLRRGVQEVVTAAGNDARLARLRITVTGGPSPLGSDRGREGPTHLVALAPISPWPATSDVVVVPWCRNERAATVGLKTTSYADNVLALAYAHQRGAAEAVFPNTVGNLCEGTGTNVFLVVEDRLVTPPLSSGCLAGVTRELLLEWVPEAEARDVPVEVLAGAREAFLTSSTRDVQPIRAVDGQVLPAAPGPRTRAVLETFTARMREDPDP